MVVWVLFGGPRRGYTDMQVTRSGVEWTLAFALMAFGWMPYARLV
jgi:hypothetical protein